METVDRQRAGAHVAHRESRRPEAAPRRLQAAAGAAWALQALASAAALALLVLAAVLLGSPHSPAPGGDGVLTLHSARPAASDAPAPGSTSPDPAPSR